PQAWNNVGIFVQCWIDAGGNQTNWVARCRQGINARLRRNQADSNDIGCAPVDQKLQRMKQGATRCQHRIHQKDCSSAEVFRQSFQIWNWLMGFLIPRHTDESDLSIWNHRQRRINHAQSSSDNRHDNWWIKQTCAVSDGYWSLAIKMLNWQISGS